METMDLRLDLLDLLAELLDLLVQFKLPVVELGVRLGLRLELLLGGLRLLLKCESNRSECAFNVMDMQDQWYAPLSGPCPSVVGPHLLEGDG